MNVRLPSEIATSVRNASARLGVQPNVVVRAACRRFADEITEDEALAESDPELAAAIRRKRAAAKARKALSA